MRNGVGRVMPNAPGLAPLALVEASRSDGLSMPRLTSDHLY